MSVFRQICDEHYEPPLSATTRPVNSILGPFGGADNRRAVRPVLESGRRPDGRCVCGDAGTDCDCLVAITAMGTAANKTFGNIALQTATAGS